MKETFLADFHMHTTYSDGKMSMKEVIDLCGQKGLGAIAITDHIGEDHTLVSKAAILLEQAMNREGFARYMEELKEETQRAWDQYRMVVIPGFELSKNRISNRRSAHILGLGITDYVPADGDSLELVKKIKGQGALAIAAHPVFTRVMEKQTYHLWERRRELAEHMDAWEVASGPHVFPEVVSEKLPRIASSDMHVRRQMRSWKTEFHCERNPEAILDCIRKQQLRFRFLD